MGRKQQTATINTCGGHGLLTARRSLFRVRGFTLIELVMTVAVLSILTLGVMPLLQASVKRQKERQLRAALRDMRQAIDQFHREALAGMRFANTGQGQTPGQGVGGRQVNNSGPAIAFDPRTRVYVTDQTIFTAENDQRYPPDLETLVKGVDTLPLMGNGLGGRGTFGVNATDVTSQQNSAPKPKVYLRAIPVDPMTGSTDWDIRSCYQAPDEKDWDQIAVFEVHSKSKEQALNGENYSDW
jgi:general secretion pathway protein G